MRIQGHYRVSLNGFRCNNSTWDDALNRDGFADEVFFHIELRYLDGSGNMTEETVRRVTRTLGSEGDGRYVVGSGRNIFGLHRGITSGDVFPEPEPWRRRDPFPHPEDVPSLLIWEGDLVSDWEGDHTDYWIGRRVTHENFVFITPTIWERDPGEDALQGWLDWLVRAEERFGEKAREAVTGIWPQALPVFGLVSLGIRILGSLEEIWGRAGTKPIGTQRDPETGELTFRPQVIDLTQARAEQIISRNEGYGFGIRPFPYQDANYFRGDYIFWLQVERIGIPRELPPRGQPAPRPEVPRVGVIAGPPEGRPLIYRPHG